MRKLTFDDIKDLREYERERDEFRGHIVEMKKRRRVQLGDLMTITFDNTDTMRFQIQEMARIERMLTDEQIRNELDTYNQLVPDPNELSGTLFIEIDDKERLAEWLPKLVGIQRAVSIWLHDGSSVPSTPEDEERLTREETTTTVHYLKFRFMPEQVDAFAAGPVRIVVDHANYNAVVELTEEQRSELVGDLHD
jgi:phage gp29-like protein